MRKLKLASQMYVQVFRPYILLDMFSGLVASVIIGLNDHGTMIMIDLAILTVISDSNSRKNAFRQLVSEQCSPSVSFDKCRCCVENGPPLKISNGCELFYDTGALKTAPR